MHIKAGHFLILVVLSIFFIPYHVLAMEQAPFKIIVDPLYGGIEEGPIGFNNLKGKTITLDIALRLFKLLTVQGVQVILTRNQDKTVSLEERIAIANENKGDIFVGIGINSTSNKSITGIESYFVEIESEIKYLYPPNTNKNILKQIVSQLTQSSKNRDDQLLAHTLNEIVSNEVKIKNRGVKQAPFYILIGSDMPSVIIFIDFISNDIVANKLNDPEFREKIAGSIAKAILQYKQERRNK